MVKIDRKNRKVLISFDASKVDPRHREWLKIVERRVGLRDLDPQPYWGFDDLEHKAGTKLLNCFYVQAEVKKEGGEEFYCYSKAMMLQKFSFAGFLEAIEEAKLLVDFDARSGHNHGTKFRLRQDCLPMLYETATPVVETEKCEETEAEETVRAPTSQSECSLESVPLGIMIDMALFPRTENGLEAS